MVGRRRDGGGVAVRPTLREHAERLLFGSTLDDKLSDPGELDDERPGSPIAVPDRPGRPPGLWGDLGQPRFPRLLVDPKERGRALHFFANHELLAIELFALAVLRFPDAPPGFRLGVARILREEQRHLRGYLSRLGPVEFGEIPTNRFFWTTLAAAPDLPSFVAGISLTFEQANLDYAAWYAAEFRKVGDETTARVLDEVLADEIGHVRHGLTWFRQWRPGPFWDRWIEALPPPLTPARAKGLGWQREARLSAGLDSADIDRLRTWSASRGRPPDVFAFDPGVEEAAAGRSPSRTARRVGRDLGSLPMFLAGADDVVLVDHRPDSEFLATLLEVGFEIPEFAASLAGRRLGRVHPWGWTPANAARFGVPDPGAPWSKVWLCERLPALIARLDDPRIDRLPTCVVVDDAALAEAVSSIPGPVALKAPYSTAGRGLRRAPASGWAASVLASQGALLVEPWCDRVFDLSVQLDTVGRIDPWRRVLVGEHGRYLGAVLGRWNEDVPKDVRRFLAESGPTIEALARAVRAELPAIGFAGLDLFVHRTRDGLRLRVAELNPRPTMGRIALAIERRVHRGRVGLWRFVTEGEVGPLGPWAEALRAAHPTRMDRVPPLLTGGVLFTTDPRGAAITSVLVVAANLSEAQGILGLP